MSHAIRSGTVVAFMNLAPNGVAGLAPRSASGLYAPLRARDVLLGVIALESHTSAAFDRHHVDLLAGAVEPLSLAIDNAQWFTRLRIVGAEQERSRIARELHDRIGQSLAYLAFELDRVLRSTDADTKTRTALESLRDDVRSVVGEVRDTLQDLRTDVSEQHSFETTLRGFLERVTKRSGLSVSFRAIESHRLALPVEREMLRIAMEAVTNVERHARAKEFGVLWVVDDNDVSLVISDDGVGVGQGATARMDSYGILGMRERATGIGAQLDFEINQRGGTTVRVHLKT